MIRKTLSTLCVSGDRFFGSRINLTRKLELGIKGGGIRDGRIGEAVFEGLFFVLAYKTHLDFTVPPTLALLEIREAVTPFADFLAFLQIFSK
jgi:hypothetical protein